jgi:hypothetical protein
LPRLVESKRSPGVEEDTGSIDANVYTMRREARAAFEKVNSKGSIVSITPETNK